jgi:hypothetical protein
LPDFSVWGNTGFFILSADIRKGKFLKMKKQWVLILGVLLVFAFAGCDSNDDDSPGVSKTLIISGVPAPTGAGVTGIVVGLKRTDTQTDDWVAFGYGPGEGTVTIQLSNRTSSGGYGETDWTGSGEYYILAWKSKSGSFEGRGDPDWYIPSSKVNFQEAETTIAGSSFQTFP